MSSEIDQMLVPLVAAINAQTKAMSELVQSNQQVIALLTEVVASLPEEEGDYHSSSHHYLDGSPVNGMPETL